MDVVDVEHVCQEQSVEQPALEQTGQAGPVFECIVIRRPIRGCRYGHCWIWPKQFMSKALSRICFMPAPYTRVEQSVWGRLIAINGSRC